jgi:uncharacterized protein YdhG (YjbR/CyaY superfamily)
VSKIIAGYTEFVAPPPPDRELTESLLKTSRAATRKAKDAVDKIKPGFDDDLQKTVARLSKIK